MLYEMILLASMLEFGAALKVILGALDEKRPLMFYCKAGKDRTGLLAMLVLSCCEVSDQDIIDDYFMCALVSAFHGLFVPVPRAAGHACNVPKCEAKSWCCHHSHQVPTCISGVSWQSDSFDQLLQVRDPCADRTHMEL